MVVRRRLHLGGAVVGRRERRIAAQGLEFGLELGDLRVGGELLLGLLLERLGRPRLGRLGGRSLGSGRSLGGGRRLGGGQRRLRGPCALEGLSVADALEAELGLGVAEALGARLRELLAVARERALLEGLGAVPVLVLLPHGRPRLAVLREGRRGPRVGVATRRRRRDGLVAFATRRVAVLGGGRLVQRARGLVGLGRVFLGRRELAALPEGRVREEVVLVDALQLLLEGLREALELAELLGERRAAPREAELGPGVAPARETERRPRVERVVEDRVEDVVNRRVVAPGYDAARLLRVREGARGG